MYPRSTRKSWRHFPWGLEWMPAWREVPEKTTYPTCLSGRRRWGLGWTTQRELEAEGGIRGWRGEGQGARTYCHDWAWSVKTLITPGNRILLWYPVFTKLSHDIIHVLIQRLLVVITQCRRFFAQLNTPQIREKCVCNYMFMVVYNIHLRTCRDQLWKGLWWKWVWRWWCQLSLQLAWNGISNFCSNLQ